MKYLITALAIVVSVVFCLLTSRIYAKVARKRKDVTASETELAGFGIGAADGAK